MSGRSRSAARTMAKAVGVAPTAPTGTMGFGQGALGFHPTDLPCVVFGWTTESLGGLADGTPVAAIYPVVSNNMRSPMLQVTGAKQPIFKTNVRNGYPALQLDGVQQCIQHNTNDPNTNGGGTGYASHYFTLVTVCMNTTTDDNLDHWAWGMLTCTDTAIDLNWNSTNDFYFIAGGASTPNGSAIGDQNKWHIMGGSVSAGVTDASYFRLDGVQYVSTSNVTFQDPKVVGSSAGGMSANVGARSAGGRFWGGFIAEGWMFDGYLSTPDWKRLEQYFSRKYSIPVS